LANPFDAWHKRYPMLKAFHQVLLDTINEKVYEPVQRNKDGLRWIRHRFPIKNGISYREVMKEEVTKHNHMSRICQNDN
jgi:hypothetical protein